jgi:imidazolonepropionase
MLMRSILWVGQRSDSALKKSLLLITHNYALSLSNKMGAELGAEVICHLEQVSDKAIASMAKKGCIGVILPTTAYILRLPSPPVRKLMEAEVPLALGSDFNPNAFCLAMVIVL